MLTLVKLGGSLITDKRVEKSFRRDVVKRLADDFMVAYIQDPSLELIIGHGSGSFGHFAASRANTINGVKTSDEWKAFAQVSNVAAELNGLVIEVLQSAGLPVWGVQPSATLLASDGVVTSMSIDSLLRSLSCGLIPVIYGDTSFDLVRGGTIISTEKLFFYLCSVLSVHRIFLLGEVSGVYDGSGSVIESITQTNYPSLISSFGGSAGVDVTGGMETKVEDMLSVVNQFSDMTIRIFGGLEENLLSRALLGTALPGTLISK
ncbi:MAG: uridylate kinase [Anaerolineaceae bacterium]|nr:uridylate kinase [Anaerolineaceae bacterium]